MDLERIHGAIAEGMTAPVFACDLDGRPLYINPAGERFCGYTLDSLQGLSCRDLILDFPQPASAVDLSRLTEFESRVRTADAGEREVRVTLWPLLDTGGVFGHCMMLEDMRDVQQLLEALRESETRYRILVENMLNGLAQYRVILDEQGRPVNAVFCEVNTAFEKITGISRDAVIGMRVTEVRPDVDHEWVELIGQVALTGAPVRFERHSRRMGKWFAMLAYSPREGYCAIVSEDITERKLAMHALQESEARYRELVESAHSLIIKITADGRLLFLNGSACRFFGVTADAVGTVLSAQDVTEEQFRRQLMLGIRRRTDQRDYEWPVRAADGSLRWISWSLRAICDEQGEAEAYLVFGHDITESRQAAQALAESEEKFRALFNNASDGIFIRGADGGFLEANEVLCRRLCCDRQTVLGSLPEVIYGTQFAETLSRRLGETMPEPLVLESTETGCDGMVRPVEMSVRRISYGGEPALLAIVRDISERRRVEDAQRMAALGQLSAGVAHEFNNLLAAMMMKAEIVALEQKPESYEQLVRQVVRSCRRGAAICQNMIAFASPREPQREPLQIEEPIETALAITTRQMATADITVQRDYDTDGALVMADPGQIEQVFLNLLINAYHAMPTGGTLQVMTRREGDSVVVTVSDTGTGIAGEHLSRVFEPFFTTKGRLGQSDMPGTGLGLSVSHGIIGAHGGSIAARSQPGRGTQFTVTLPVYQEVTPAEGQLPAADHITSSSSHRVLVAEDETDICGLLAQVLSRRGYEVVVAADTPQALQALEATPFSLIVADWLMPGGGGRQIVAHARQMPSNPPVIIITGKPGMELMQKLEPNVVCCLQKPFHLTELLDAVQDALAT
jgi:two-component system cell cycle sensor histidine kinase/response regulator CckA